MERGGASRLGRRIIDLNAASGGMAALVVSAVQDLLRRSMPWRQHLGLWAEQVLQWGQRSIPLVFVTGVATGSVMALQFGYGLMRFGGTRYVPTLVGLAVLRELGPVLTSLLLAGRVGSGMASELASMAVTQQVDAYRALGTSPASFLALPRIAACLVVFPVLTLFADYVALASAMLVSRGEFAMTPEYYYSKTVEVVTLTDLTTGVGKAAIFGLIVGVAACWRGLNASGGTHGVGRATTWVVVVSSVLILMGDLALSKLLILLGVIQ